MSAEVENYICKWIKRCVFTNMEKLGVHFLVLCFFLGQEEFQGSVPKFPVLFFVHVVVLITCLATWVDK